MIKVMIVDDEYLIRIGIKSTIQWEENGFEIVGDAANGEEALKLCHELQPDIVITDIKMPKMDGLELTRHLKNQYSNIKIIILSSHNDFAFAKEALTLGASDYILKATMEPQEILKTLMNVKLQIEEETKETDKVKRRVGETIFAELLKGSLKLEENNLDSLRKLGVKVAYSDCMLICGRIDGFEKQYRRVDPLTKRLLKDSIIHIFQSKMHEDYQGEVELLNEEVFVCLLSVNRLRYACEDAGYSFAKAVQDSVKNYTRVTISLSISDCIHEFADIPKKLQETLEYLKYKVFLGSHSLITYKQMQTYNQEEIKAFSCEEEKIKFYLLNGQKEVVEELVNNIFEQLNERRYSIVLLNYICTQFISLLNRISVEVGVNREGDKIFFEVQEPMCLESITEIKDWFRNQFNLLSDRMGTNTYNCGSSVIRSAIKYIRSSYMNNLTLGDVAEQVNISRVYFSQLFKQETGEKYIDFLNKVRIDKAKEYLSFTDLKTYEVAEKVGFQDSGYFTKMFKKIVGKTPSEFQKEIYGENFGEKQ